MARSTVLRAIIDELEEYFGEENCLITATTEDMAVRCGKLGESAWLQCDEPTSDSTPETLTWCTVHPTGRDCEIENVDEETLAALQQKNL